METLTTTGLFCPGRLPPWMAAAERYRDVLVRVPEQNSPVVVRIFRVNMDF